MDGLNQAKERRTLIGANSELRATVQNLQSIGLIIDEILEVINGPTLKSLNDVDRDGPSPVRENLVDEFYSTNRDLTSEIELQREKLNSILRTFK